MKLIVSEFYIICSVSSIIYIYLSSNIVFAPNIIYLEVRNVKVNIHGSKTRENIFLSEEVNNDAAISYISNSNDVLSFGDLQNLSTTILKLRYAKTKLQVDLNFAKTLREAQHNTEVPLVNDIVVSNHNDSWRVYVIINNGNTHNESFRYYKSMNVTLEMNKKIYYNMFPECIIYNLRVLKYIVPEMKPSGKLTLVDHSRMIEYKDLPYQAIIKQPKRKVAVCAYISRYNFAAEIKSWLAFYLLQGIDTIIFYCSVNCDYFQNLLKKEIDIGYVILYEYYWPLTKRYGPIQLSVQGSQINSCYYRHREYFEYIISQDVDEYFYSELYPYNLYKAITKAFELFPDKLSLAV